MNAKEKPEIIYAWNYLEWGGAQIYFLGIMRLALAKGYKVKALMPVGTGEKLLNYFEQENIEVEFFNARIDLSKAESFAHKIRRRFNDWRCNLILARNLARRDLSNKIVHIDAAPWSAFALLFYIALKTDVFVTLHIAQPTAPTLRNRWIKLKYRALYMLPKFHLLASNLEMLENLRWFASPEKWREIPLAYTGINTDEINETLNTDFDRAELMRKHGLPLDKKLVFALGNIVERKGFRVFTEAARLLQKDAPELFFVWVGDGEKRGEMESLIKSSGLGDSVKIILRGAIGEKRQDILRLLSLADIYVLPSFAEGLPGAMLEAMALRKAVVASKVNAVPEAIENRVTGLLATAGNAEEFAKAILELSKDDVLRETLETNAQIKVFNDFTEKRCAEVHVDFYERGFSLR